MVYKTKFLKKRIVSDYDPTADETKTFDLTDDALAAIWITIKGDLVAADKCLDELADLVTTIDVWMGGLNIVHYMNTMHCVVMNSLLKQNRPMLIGNGQAIDDVMGLCFPILFGSPYLTESMALPHDHDNLKTLILGLDIASGDFDDLLLDITEVILPDGHPVGFIKQEEVSLNAQGTGDKDIKLQTNWDLLKLTFKCPTVPVDAAWTTTLNRVGLEIDDFVFGYQGVPWTICHGELMDELGGMAGIENHSHTGDSFSMAEDLEHWLRLYGVLDFFHEKDLKWRAPIRGASTAKLKVNYGVDEGIYYAQANYVTVAQLHKLA